MCLSTVAIKLNSVLVQTMQVFSRTVTYECFVASNIVNWVINNMIMYHIVSTMWYKSSAQQS